MFIVIKGLNRIALPAACAGQTGIEGGSRRPVSRTPYRTRSWKQTRNG